MVDIMSDESEYRPNFDLSIGGLKQAIFSNYEKSLATWQYYGKGGQEQII